IENRGLHKIPRFALRDFRAAAVENGFRAFAHSSVNQRLDAMLAFFRDDGPHLQTGLESVAHANGGSGLRDGVAKRLLRFANGDRDGNGKTALPRAAKRAVANDL